MRRRTSCRVSFLLSGLLRLTQMVRKADPPQPMMGQYRTSALATKTKGWGDGTMTASM